MKHHATVQSARERYISRREEILNNFLTLFCTESEYPYHVRGGAPEAPPCISGTIHQKVTKLLEHTYVGKCRGFKA